MTTTTTTLTAAANTTKTIDFSAKTSTTNTGDSSAFASKLQDARREAKPEPTPHAADAKKPAAAKPKHDDDDDAADRADATVDSKPAKPAKKPDDRPVDQADDAEEPSEKSADEKPTPAVKTTDDALLAALAASATPVAAAPDAKPTDATPADATPNDQAVATLAAAATIQANAPVAIDDAADASTEAKPQAAAVDAKAKPGDAKVDALTAKLKPVDDPNAPLPPEATERHAGGDAQKQSSHQQQQSPGDGNAPAAQASDAVAMPAAKADATKDASFDDLLSKLATPDVQQPRDATPTPAPAAATLRPEQQFARDNVDRVVSTVQSHVEAGGNGTMNVRLDPPELGALDVAAKMLDGKMSVSFTTSNEQATQLLSHSLNHLKSSLESAGITVDRIEVRQGAATSTNASSSDRESSGQQQPGGRGFESASQQQGEQQRKQMVERLWRKYAYGSDEVDLVA